MGHHSTTVFIMTGPNYTLYVPEASFRAFAILIAAEFNGIDIVVNTSDTKQAMGLSKTGKLPLLTIDETTSIFSSASIARYIANLRSDTKLMGNDIVQAAEIDAWMDWSLTELELPATVWFFPVISAMPFHDAAYEKAKTDLAKALGILEAALTNEYLVGDSISLADITIVSTLLYPFKLVCDAEYVKSFPKVVAWFQRCTNLPEFQQVVGVVTMCQKELKAR